MKVDFNLISTFSIIAPLVFGAFLYRSLSTDLRILFSLVLFTFIAEIPTRILYELGINNMFLFHIQTYVEFYFLIYLYHRLMRRIVTQKLVRVSAVLFLVASLLFYFRDSIYQFNTGQRYAEMYLLMFVMLAFIIELFNLDSALRIRKNPFFWLTAGYLIYFAGTALLFLMQQRFLAQGDNSYWVIHGIFNIFLNIVLTFVLWHGREKSW